MSGIKEGNELEIRHTSSVIYARLPGSKEKAWIAYEVEGNIMKLLKTYTPPEYRGKGIAAKLTQYAIELAKKNGWVIEPVCSYAIHYFIKHPELRELLKPELRNADLRKLFEERLKEERASKA